MRIKLLIVIGFIFLCSCSNNLDKTSYVNYFENVQKNGSSENIEAISYSALAIPTEYLILKDNPELSIEQVEKEKKKYERKDHLFLFEIRTPVSTSAMAYNTENKEEELNRLQLLSTQMEKYFSINVNGKINNCKMVVFERKYAVSNVISLRAFFQFDYKTGEKAKLIFDDVLFGNGRVKLDVTDNLNNQPHLK